MLGTPSATPRNFTLSHMIDVLTEILVAYISLCDVHTLLFSLHAYQVYAAYEYYDSCTESSRSK